MIMQSDSASARAAGEALPKLPGSLAAESLSRKSSPLRTRKRATLPPPIVGQTRTKLTALFALRKRLMAAAA